MAISAFELVSVLGLHLITLSWFLRAVFKPNRNDRSLRQGGVAWPIVFWHIPVLMLRFVGLWMRATAPRVPLNLSELSVEAKFQAASLFGMWLLWNLVGAILLLFTSRSVAQDAPDIWSYCLAYFVIELPSQIIQVTAFLSLANRT
ncbi:hypothetical protein OF83DRAFT_1170881 [Amylostereum chailletii]|nr:hypothetical protein OF83DRAFT_1170881 [Amylostereum chailletii]